MEPTSVLENKIKTLKQTLGRLEKAIDIDMAGLEDTIIDTIKSGQAQKFEICVELFWKTFKKFIYEIHGIEVVSPKMVMKELYRLDYADEADYEKLIEMVNDRNRLSHIYNEIQFEEIHRHLPAYQRLMAGITKKIII